MAKKTRKQKQRAATRRVVTTTAPRPSAPDTFSASATPAADVGAGSPVTAARDASSGGDGDATAVAASVAPRRRVERLNQATSAPAAGRGRPGRGPASVASMFEPLDAENSAIPFDRVPYVPSDLRRVAIIASAMVGLIIIAALIVSNVVK